MAFTKKINFDFNNDGVIDDGFLDIVGNTGSISYAKVTTSVAFSLANNLTDEIPFDTEIEDTDNFWDVGNSTRLTIPSDGYYLILGQVEFENNSINDRLIRIFKNGTTVETIDRRRSSNSIDRLQVSCICNATTGDYYELSVFQDSGSTLNVGPNNTFFSIIKLNSGGGGSSGFADNLIVAYEDGLDATIVPEFTVSGAGTSTFTQGGIQSVGGSVSYSSQTIVSPQRVICARLLYRVATTTPPFSRLTIRNETSAPNTMISLFWNSGANGDLIIFDHNSATTLDTVITAGNDAGKFFDVKLTFNPYSKRVKVFITDLTDTGEFQATGEGVYSGTCNSTDDFIILAEIGQDSWLHRLEVYNGVR